MTFKIDAIRGGYINNVPDIQPGKQGESTPPNNNDPRSKRLRWEKAEFERKKQKQR